MALYDIVNTIKSMAIPNPIGFYNGLCPDLSCGVPSISVNYLDTTMNTYLLGLLIVVTFYLVLLVGIALTAE
jgi:hypothetical protein